MKSQKLFVIAAIVCMLLGVSGGAAMATGCGDGLIQNETFDGSLIIDNEPCTIISSTIQGDIIITDSAYVVLLNNKVGGTIEVIRTDGQEGRGVANVIANTVFAGQIRIIEYRVANVIENETLKGVGGVDATGDIRVIGNTKALIQKNIAAQNLICLENTDSSAFLNIAGNTLSCDE